MWPKKVMYIKEKTFANKNKILIFSRYNQTLDVIRNYLLKELFPFIKYDRIDGKVIGAKRF